MQGPRGSLKLNLSMLWQAYSGKPKQRLLLARRQCAGVEVARKGYLCLQHELHGAKCPADRCRLDHDFFQSPKLAERRGLAPTFFQLEDQAAHFAVLKKPGINLLSSTDEVQGDFFQHLGFPIRDLADPGLVHRLVGHFGTSLGGLQPLAEQHDLHDSLRSTAKHCFELVRNIVAEIDLRMFPHPKPK